MADSRSIQVILVCNSSAFKPSGHSFPFASPTTIVRWASWWDDETVVWFWIGPHHEYDRLIGRG